MAERLSAIYELRQRATEQGRVVERRLPDGSWVLLADDEDETDIAISDLRLSAYVTAAAGFAGGGKLARQGLIQRHRAGRPPRLRGSLKERIRKLHEGGLPLADLVMTADGGHMTQDLVKVMFGETVHHVTYETALRVYLTEIGKLALLRRE